MLPLLFLFPCKAMQDFSFLPLFYMVRARPPQSKAFNSRNNLRFICFCAPAHFRFPFFQNNFLCRVIHSLFFHLFLSLFRFAADTTNGPPILPQSKEKERKVFSRTCFYLLCLLPRCRTYCRPTANVWTTQMPPQHIPLHNLASGQCFHKG